MSALNLAALELDLAIAVHHQRLNELDRCGFARPFPKLAQPPREHQPAYERQAITDDDIRHLRMRLADDGNGYAVKMCDRAIGGDVSAVNACKAMIHGLR